MSLSLFRIFMLAAMFTSSVFFAGLSILFVVFFRTDRYVVVRNPFLYLLTNLGLAIYFCAASYQYCLDVMNTSTLLVVFIGVSFAILSLLVRSIRILKALSFNEDKVLRYQALSYNFAAPDSQKAEGKKKIEDLVQKDVRRRRVRRFSIVAILVGFTNSYLFMCLEFVNQELWVNIVDISLTFVSFVIVSAILWKRDDYFHQTSELVGISGMVLVARLGELTYETFESTSEIWADLGLTLIFVALILGMYVCLIKLYLDVRKYERDLKSGSAKSRSDVFMQFLTHPTARAYFQTHLVREFSVENLYFVLDIEEYRKLSALEEKREKVRQLYNNYLRSGSPFELNISSAAREEATSGCQYWMGGQENELEKQRSLSRRESVGFSPLFEEEDESHVAPIDHVFDRAVQEILHTLRTDSFPRFLQSETYEKMPASLKFAGFGSRKDKRKSGQRKMFSV
eukprot:TRINITY_DN82863_c0_g1_i1.p1 TRINITY_DN82863_c0_g1~~TRINITY_DN82863_c0_g1_i1.p1  ORF type:complete len:455 (-),score=101.06 TRINITY_DN82863_c0_g1_i1:85-1449(-)